MTTKERIQKQHELANLGEKIKTLELKLSISEEVANNLAVDVVELKETIKGYKVQLNARGYHEVTELKAVRAFSPCSPGDGNDRYKSDVTGVAK